MLSFHHLNDDANKGSDNTFTLHRTQEILNLLTLFLFMFRIFTNDTNHTITLNNLAVTATFLNRRFYFHFFPTFFILDPRFREDDVTPNDPLQTSSSEDDGQEKTLSFFHPKIRFLHQRIILL